MSTTTPVANQCPQVEGNREQAPFCRYAFQAPEEEPVESLLFFENPKHRFDEALALVRKSLGLLGLHPAAVLGEEPVIRSDNQGPSLAPVRRTVSMGRTGPAGCGRSPVYAD